MAHRDSTSVYPKRSFCKSFSINLRFLCTEFDKYPGRRLPFGYPSQIKWRLTLVILRIKICSGLSQGLNRLAPCSSGGNEMRLWG